MQNTYIVSKGAHTSSYGNVNYIGSHTVEDRNATIERIQQDHPQCVVLDGDDNWYAKDVKRVSFWYNKAQGDYKPLAWFHTGISGVSQSGAVISREHWLAIPEYTRKEMEKHIKIYGVK